MSIPMLSNIAIEQAVEKSIDRAGLEIPDEDQQTLRRVLVEQLGVKFHELEKTYVSVKGTLKKHTADKDIRVLIEANRTPRNLCSLAEMATDVTIFAPQSDMTTVIRNKEAEKEIRQTDMFAAGTEHCIKIYNGEKMIELQPGTIVTALRDITKGGELIAQAGQKFEFVRVDENKMYFTCGAVVYQKSWSGLGVDPADQPKRSESTDSTVMEEESIQETQSQVSTLAEADLEAVVIENAQISALCELEYDGRLIKPGETYKVFEVDPVEKTIAGRRGEGSDESPFVDVALSSDQFDNWELSQTEPNGEPDNSDTEPQEDIFDSLNKGDHVRMKEDSQGYSAGCVFEIIGLDRNDGTATLREYLPDDSTKETLEGDGNAQEAHADEINLNFEKLGQ